MGSSWAVSSVDQKGDWRAVTRAAMTVAASVAHLAVSRAVATAARMDDRWAVLKVAYSVDWTADSMGVHLAGCWDAQMVVHLVV
jgi:hypothetical protein